MINHTIDVSTSTTLAVTMVIEITDVRSMGANIHTTE
jgi:hypothetical protein